MSSTTKSTATFGVEHPVVQGGVGRAETVAAVTNAGARLQPAPHLPMFHDNGIKVLHKCTSVRRAVKAHSLGVDGISIDQKAVFDFPEITDQRRAPLGKLSLVKRAVRSALVSDCGG